MMILAIVLVSFGFGLTAMSMALESSRTAASFMKLGVVYLCTFSLMLFVGEIARREAKGEAVKAGHAEYYLDPETCQREWSWLAPCKQEMNNEESPP